MRLVATSVNDNYYVIEPGDATRYTVFYIRGDEVIRGDGGERYDFVAIGPGDAIQGGYAVPAGFRNGVLADLREAAEQGESMAHALVKAVDYWKGHTPIDNAWTCVVAILFVIVARNSRLYHSELIENVFANKHQEVLDEIDSF